MTDNYGHCYYCGNKLKSPSFDHINYKGSDGNYHAAQLCPSCTEKDKKRMMPGDIIKGLK